jgi:hypothetical protein
MSTRNSSTENRHDRPATIQQSESEVIQATATVGVVSAWINAAILCITGVALILLGITGTFSGKGSTSAAVMIFGVVLIVLGVVWYRLAAHYRGWAIILGALFLIGLIAAMFR